MRKQMLVLVLVVLLVGVVLSAPSNLTNFVIGDFVAGGTSVATFSFDYLNDGSNLPDGSLVLRVNMSFAEDECSLDNCSVLAGDFFMSGFVEQFPLFGWFGLEKTTPLQCLEKEEIEFFNGNGLIYTHVDGTNGTFYCYDPSNYLDMLDLGRRDYVTLEIGSHYALYPGNYSMSVELMEMERDVAPPVMELILNDFVFGENDTIPIRLNVSDMYNVMSVEYEITNPELSEFYASGWIDALFNVSSGLYEDDFNMTEYGLNESGSYWIKARSCDVLENCGEL